MIKFKEYLNSNKKIHIYLDMDGVLCNFNIPKDCIIEDDYIKTWYNVYNKYPNFWIDLPWLKEGKILYEYLINENSNIQLNILSAWLKGTKQLTDWSIEGKKNWIKSHGLTKHIHSVNIVKRSDKYTFVDQSDKIISILIDDYSKNINKWVEVGGIGILFKDHKDTIDKLKNILK